MSYTTQQDILDFVEDNNVKFVRFAFCDIFGVQKNIAVLASDLPKAPSASSISSRTTTMAVPPASPSTQAVISMWLRWMQARTCAGTSA